MGKSNFAVLRTMTLVGVIASFLTLIVSFFIPSYFNLRIPYIIVLASSGMFLMLIYKFRHSPKALLACMYTLVGILLAFSIYLSIGSTPELKATIFLAFLIATPLLIVDVSWRVNLVPLSAFLAHFALTFIFKDNATIIFDFINSSLCFVFGVFIGTNLRDSKIQNFDLQLQAQVLTETDFLTGLFNRRRMYEDMVRCEESDINLNGVILLDIDWFKGFNDHYGHRQGDECLRKLGAFLNEFGKDTNMTFYRYGGEEIIGFSFSEEKIHLDKIAEDLRKGVLALEVPYPDSPMKFVSVSVGFGYKENFIDLSIEQLIEKVDIALYKAKNNGRNRCQES